ncbi:MAG TPA: ABC transporter permease [Candidatus Acidoferrum sp.]|nr:ABC transporter permease [Candidatus Acidoferrum sp.]
MSEGATTTVDDSVAAGRRRQMRRQLRRLFGNPLSAIGLALSGLFVLMALAAPLLAPHDPLAMDPSNRLAAPSALHWFGTDDGGRDILARVVYGTRSSLLTALGILSLASVIGTSIGLAAGSFGGWVDETLMRITDMFLAFPALVLAMGLAAALGPSLFNAMLATAVVWWPWYARLVRGQALHLKNEAFVEAARVAGASGLRIAVRHILRNCLTPIIVQMSLDIGYAILTLSSLSFIGLGAQAPTPEWGSMVSIGRDYFLDQWWIVTFPGLAIFLSVMAFNLLGDGLQEALSPRLRR